MRVLVYMYVRMCTCTYIHIVPLFSIFFSFFLSPFVNSISLSFDCFELKHSHTHTYTHPYTKVTHNKRQNVEISIQTHTLAGTHIRTSSPPTQTHIYICIHTHTHAYTHIHNRARTHTLTRPNVQTLSFAHSHTHRDFFNRIDFFIFLVAIYEQTTRWLNVDGFTLLPLRLLRIVKGLCCSVLQCVAVD